MITALEYLFLALLTLGTGLMSAYVVYMVIKPRAERLVTDVTSKFSDFANTVPGRIKKELNSFFKEVTEGVDLGGGEAGSGGLGDIAGLLGGGGGGLGEILGLLSKLGGKGKEGGGSSGW